MSHSLPKCDYCKCAWHSNRFLQWDLLLLQRLQNICCFHLLPGTRTSQTISAVKPGNTYIVLGCIGNLSALLGITKSNKCRIKLDLQDRHFRGYVLWLIIQSSWKCDSTAYSCLLLLACKHQPLLMQLNRLASIAQDRYSPKILPWDTPHGFFTFWQSWPLPHIWFFKCLYLGRKTFCPRICELRKFEFLV